MLSNCTHIIKFLFVYLGSTVPLENYSFIWRRNHCRWRAANFDLARHSWPLSSEGSMACHTYYNTGHLFIMVISESLWNSHQLPNVYQWSYHYLFYDLCLSLLGFEHQTFRLRCQRSNPLRHRRKPCNSELAACLNSVLSNSCKNNWKNITTCVYLNHW